MSEQALDVLRSVGARVFERGWLSSNNVLFAEAGATTVVDTGYAIHAQMTMALLSDALGGRPLQRIVNTHLHSDHCGGNAALQGHWECEAWVPQASFDVVRRWDESVLTYAETGQLCPRFEAHRAIAPGECLSLGGLMWEVHSAPGHDPDAVMLFEPTHRVLISGDALWEHGVAIIFPELEGLPGFDEALRALGAIEALAPNVVIPGHGAPFTAIGPALEQSRLRIEGFAANPSKHDAYAMRALLMFHMLEQHAAERHELEGWVRATPLLQRPNEEEDREARLQGALSRLLRDGTLIATGSRLTIPN